MTATPTATDAVPTEAGAAPLPAVSAGPRPAGPTLLRGRVLLAEDGLENQQILSLYLRKAGAEVVIAENGRVAVEQAMSQPLDLILMDMQMPELDGFAATRQLRAGGCTLPIIALTAHTSAETRWKCFDAGCTGHIVKPVERNTLLECVAGHLAGHRPAGATAAAAPLAPEPAVPAGSLRSSFADDPAMQAAITEFVALLPRRVAGMERLLAAGNLAELRRVVHQIKGAGGGFGFDDVTRLADEVICALKQDLPAAAIRGKVDLLIALIRSVEGYQPSRELSHA